MVSFGDFSFSVKGNITLFHWGGEGLPNTNDKNSREGNSIFKFLEGYHKQQKEKNKLKFSKNGI